MTLPCSAGLYGWASLFSQAGNLLSGKWVKRGLIIRPAGRVSPLPLSFQAFRLSIHRTASLASGYFLLVRPGSALLDGRHQLSMKARHHICQVCGGIGYGLKVQKFLVQAKRRTGYVVHVRMCALQGVKVLIFSFLLPFRYRFCPYRATAKNVDIIPRAPLRLPRAESLLPLRGAIGG